MSNYISLLEIRFGSGTRFYSHVDVSAPGSFYRGKVLSFGSLTREIPRVPDIFIISDVTIRLSNADLEFSKLRAENAFRNRQCLIKLGEKNDPIANFTTVFTGRITRYRFIESGLVLELTISDSSQDRLMRPAGLRITRELFPNIPNFQPNVQGPIVYGSVSSAPFGGGGAYICPYVDAVNFKYVVAQHPVKVVSNVYRYGVLVTAGFSVIQETIGGQTWTLLKFTADQEDPNRRGEPTITVDCDGVTDSVGNLITNPIDGLKDFLIRFCEYQVAELNTSSFDTAKARAAARGFKLGGAIVSDISRAEIITQWARSFGIDFFYDRFGKVTVSIYDKSEFANLSAKRELTDDLDILHGSFQIIPNEFPISRLQYNYAMNYVRNFFERQPDFVDSTTKNNLGGEDLRDNVSMFFTRDDATALNIAKLRQFYSDEFADEIECQLPITSAGLDLTETVRLSHFSGINREGLGYKREPYKVRKIVLDLDRLKLTVSLQRWKIRQMMRLGDRTKLSPKWTQATDSDKEFTYLCDRATQKFSDGADGKRLY